MLKSPPVVALARPRFKFDPKRVREVLNKIETDVEVATEAALERGIYAASMSTSKRAMKRH